MCYIQENLATLLKRSFPTIAIVFVLAHCFQKVWTCSLTIALLHIKILKNELHDLFSLSCDQISKPLKNVYIWIILHFQKFIKVNILEKHPHPRRHLLVQSQLWKCQINVRNLLKVYNKDIRTTPASSWCLHF